MQITIIGAGAVSTVLVDLLNRVPSVSHIIVASKYITQEKKYFNKSPKISFAYADASKCSSIVSVARDSQLIINASLPDFNLNIMEAALQANSHYQDLASENKKPNRPLNYRSQFQYHQKFKNQNKIALINTGISPGVTNLMVAEAAAHFDSIQSIKIRTIEDQESSQFISSWSREQMLDTVSSKPLALKNGKYVWQNPLSESEEYEFPAPFGRKMVYNLYNDEIITLLKYLKVKHIDYKASGSDIITAKLFCDVGLLETKPISVKGVKLVPRDILMALLPAVPNREKMKNLISSGMVKSGVFLAVAEVYGKYKKNNFCMKSVAAFPEISQISRLFFGATYISYPTAVAAAAFAQVIPIIPHFGVYAPEGLDAIIRKKVLMQLEKDGIIITQSRI